MYSGTGIFAFWYEVQLRSLMHDGEKRKKKHETQV